MKNALGIMVPSLQPSPAVPGCVRNSVAGTSGREGDPFLRSGETSEVLHSELGFLGTRETQI